MPGGDGWRRPAEQAELDLALPAEPPRGECALVYRRLADVFVGLAAVLIIVAVMAVRAASSGGQRRAGGSSGG